MTAKTFSGRFDGQVALVTAAAMGIGGAVATRLAAEGAVVVCVDVSPSIHEVAAAIKFAGGSAVSFQADVTDHARMQEIVQSVHLEHGAISVLVNGVGRSSVASGAGGFCATKPSDWADVIDLSLKAGMSLCQQVLPSMVANGYGRVVNISSVSWLMPTEGFADYAAAKAGVVGFSRVLAIETAEHGVTVNAVSPGPIETAATENHPQSVKDKVSATIPMGHYGQPEDVAAAILFLASPEARFITAQNLVVGGGRGIV